MEISQLRELQKHFESVRGNTVVAKELYIESEKLSKQFRDKFSLEKLPSMTLDEYVEGHGSKDSFCYLLERKTDPVGRLFAGGAGYGFNVYYNKKNSADLNIQR